MCRAAELAGSSWNGDLGSCSSGPEVELTSEDVLAVKSGM